MAFVKEKNDFNRIAKVYDTLAKVVFGNAIRQAQVSFLDSITSNSKVLIIGGGTGWILNEILKLNVFISIDYVEKSDEMIHLAKSNLKTVGELRINFIHSSFEECNLQENYDFIICNFFLDVFPENKLDKVVIPKLGKLLLDRGKLIVSDFRKVQSSKSLSWQNWLIHIMYAFFDLTCRIESRQLADFNKLLKQESFYVERENFFFSKMIFSRLYGLKH